MSVTGDHPQVPAVSWRHTAGAVLRSTLGAVTLVGGLAWLLLNIQGPQVLTDVLVGAVLAAGGLVLLMPHRIRLGRAERYGAAVTALAGTAAGLLILRAQLGGMYAYVQGRGYPFEWVRRGAVAEDPDTARRLAGTANWQVDVPAVAGGVLFWGYAGMLVLLGVGLARRARRERVGARP